MIFNCHFANSIVNVLVRFLFPFPEAIETNWHLVFHFVLCCFFLFSFVCSILPEGWRKLVNVDDSISNNSPYCIIAHTRPRVCSCSTPAKEKRQTYESNLLISSRDRTNSLISCRKRLFIFHLTLEIIIKGEDDLHKMNTKD